MEERAPGGMDRRGFLKRAGIAAAGLGLLACAPAAAPTATPTKAPAPTSAATAAPAAKPAAAPTPSDADALAKLYEAAKKEGEVMVYSMGTEQEWKQFADDFGKQFPGVKTSGYVGTSEQVQDKLLTEARARRQVGDVVFKAPIDYVYSFTKEGLLDAYISTQARQFDPGHYDPNGLWYTNMWNPFAPEYNTQAIPKEQAPKSYADLLKPEFKGKLGLEATPVFWFTGMLSIMGKEKGLEYMKKLAEQKPRLISGHTSLHKMVISGEVSVAVYMFGLRVVGDKDKGAPIEWVYPTEKTPALPNFAGVMKNAPHPNAARLMLEYTLSEAGAKVMANQLWIPTRRGVELGNLAPLAKMNVLIPGDPMFGKEVEANLKVFQDIFGRP